MRLQQNRFCSTPLKMCTFISTFLFFGRTSPVVLHKSGPCVYFAELLKCFPSFQLHLAVMHLTYSKIYRSSFSTRWSFNEEKIIFYDHYVIISSSKTFESWWQEYTNRKRTVCSHILVTPQISDARGNFTCEFYKLPRTETWKTEIRFPMWEYDFTFHHFWRVSVDCFP